MPSPWLWSEPLVVTHWPGNACWKDSLNGPPGRRRTRITLPATRRSLSELPICVPRGGAETLHTGFISVCEPSLVPALCETLLYSASLGEKAAKTPRSRYPRAKRFLSRSSFPLTPRTTIITKLATVAATLTKTATPHAEINPADCRLSGPEPPDADPHVRWCGSREGNPPGDPIRHTTS